MTVEQIVWQILIGLFLLAVGAILRPVFNRVWGWMNRPAPLSPRDKGKLVEQIATMENTLEELDHFTAHPKDLFLLMIQLLMGALLSCIVAVCLYVCKPAFLGFFRELDTLMIVFLAIMLCIAGILLAWRMSDRNIDALKSALRKRIDEARIKLNTPISE